MKVSRCGTSSACFLISSTSCGAVRCFCLISRSSCYDKFKL